MKRILLIAALLATVALISGCAPAITVENTTSIPVRVIVRSGGHSDVLSPSPGETSYTTASEGSFTAAAVPDTEWIEYAKLTRKVLNDQLANSSNLTGAQLLEVIRRLKDIAQRMQQFEAAAGKTGSCSGSVSSESDGFVRVSIGADGSLVASCK